MKSRHLARSLAMQTLYALDFAGKFYDSENNPVYQDLKDAPLALAGISEEEENRLEEDIRAYSALLIKGTIENMAQIDALIERYSEKRALDRIDRVDRNILRISFFSLLYCHDVHPNVVIDEAVKLSQEFSSVNGYKFVNGVLDSYSKEKGKNDRT